MNGFFKKLLAFSGAIVVLVLALGTFCTDPFVAKAAHHEYFAGRVSHIETAETMCHRAETATVAISPRTSESSSEMGLRQPFSKFLVSVINLPPEIDSALGKPYLFSSFGFGRHREIQDVILRS
jgi:hypothetical protein